MPTCLVDDQLSVVGPGPVSLLAPPEAGRPVRDGISEVLAYATAHLFTCSTATRKSSLVNRALWLSAARCAVPRKAERRHAALSQLRGRSNTISRAHRPSVPPTWPRVSHSGRPSCARRAFHLREVARSRGVRELYYPGPSIARDSSHCCTQQARRSKCNVPFLCSQRRAAGKRSARRTAVYSSVTARSGPPARLLCSPLPYNGGQHDVQALRRSACQGTENVAHKRN